MAGYSPWDHKELDRTEQLIHTHTAIHSVVQQKPMQFCKAIILQLKIILKNSFKNCNEITLHTH